MKIILQLRPSGPGCDHALIKDSAGKRILEVTTINELKTADSSTLSGLALQARVMLMNVSATTVGTDAKLKTYLESKEFGAVKAVAVEAVKA